MGKKPDLESVHLVNHSKCMLAAFQNFRQDETMLDVTLVCEGMSLKAHKLVLSACSPLFKEIISENPCKHPVIILRQFEFSDLRAIIDFIYKGELSVPRERLMSALKVAEELNIRGLRRSEPNREKYEKLYKVCEKLSSRKKRKRRRHDSSDSDEKEHISVSDSDQNVVDSDVSGSADDEAPVESRPMEVESFSTEINSASNKDVRPVVLRVGDPAANRREPTLEEAHEEDDECNEKTLSDDNSQKEMEEQGNEPTLDTAEESSQFDSYAVCSENSASLEYVQKDEQNSFQEQNNEAMSATKCSESIGLTSPSHLSSPEAHKSDETKLQDCGKRFICSKCDETFTSRTNFMKHKTLGHNNTEKKKSYDCKHCNFTTEEHNCFKNHLLIHSSKVPYRCSLCPEEFSSEELYNQHLSIHDVEKISLHNLPSTPGKDLFATQNRDPEKISEFRCSICFLKFTSKLRCQLHEKTCQGGS